jgi:OTU domain-containing protein 6
LKAKRAAELDEQRKIAAQEASAMPDLSEQEQRTLEKLFEMHGLRVESIRPDGNCLYAAFSSQLNAIKPTKVPLYFSRLTIVRLQISEGYRIIIYPRPPGRL